MNVLFFGRLVDAIAPELEIDMSPGISIAELRDQIASRFPDAEHALRGRRVRACVRDTVVADDYLIQAGDEVEFLPPVSGG